VLRMKATTYRLSLLAGLVSQLALLLAVGVGLVVSVWAGQAAQQATPAKKYPPYPDVWGYELPWPEEDARGVHPWFFKMPDGDIIIIYSKYIRGSSGKRQYRAQGLSLFSGKTWEFSKGEEDKFIRQNSKYQAKADRITFQDGSSLKQEGSEPPKCHDPFAYYLVKRDSAGKVVMKKNLVYVPEKPRIYKINPNCEAAGGKDSFEGKVQDVYSKFVLLEDDTFLLYGLNQNFILRADKDLTIRYRPNERFFLVEHDIIETQLIRGENLENDLDAIYHYVLTLKEGAGK